MMLARAGSINIRDKMKQKCLNYHSTHREFINLNIKIYIQ